MPRETKLVEPEIVRRAVGRQLRQAEPAHADAQPGDVRRRGRRGADHDPVLQGPRARRRRTRTCSPAWSPLFLWFTVLFANFAEAIAEGRGKAQADTLRKTRSETVARRPARRRHDRGACRAPRSTSATRCVVERRRGDPERRRGHRGHRQRRRVGDHRRVGAGHPRVGRRPLGGHRRHARAVGRDRRAHHRPAGRDVPRPDDRARRGLASARRPRTRSRSTSCSPGSPSSSCSRRSRCSRSRCSPTPSRAS